MMSIDARDTGIPKDANYENTPTGADEEQCTFRVDRISSGKGLPQIDWPPLPVPVGSPAWIMKPLMFL